MQNIIERKANELYKSLIRKSLCGVIMRIAILTEVLS